MIRAGPVGRRATYDEEYDENWEETADVEWDEKGRTNISHIYVSFNVMIRSIQFGYLENGSLVLSPKYGSSEGHSFRIVRLNKDEYVTGLSGVLAMSGDEIRNLTFHTNVGNHGPIGCLDEKYGSGFKIEILPEICDRCEFGGFFGSYSKGHLSSLGIYVSPTIASSDVVVKHENI